MRIKESFSDLPASDLEIKTMINMHRNIDAARTPISNNHLFLVDQLLWTIFIWILLKELNVLKYLLTLTYLLGQHKSNTQFPQNIGY